MSRTSSLASTNKFDHLFMIVITGDADVGKTALLQRFSQPEKEWDAYEHISTIGVDFVKKHVRVGRTDVCLQAWDTAGQERFRTITMTYYRGAFGAAICYDSSSKDSLMSASRWIDDYRERAKPRSPIILVACKVDLLSKEEQQQQPMYKALSELEESKDGVPIGIQESVDFSVKSLQPPAGSEYMHDDLVSLGKQLATTKGCGFIVTSAKTGYNVQAAFEELTRMILTEKGLDFENGQDQARAGGEELRHPQDAALQLSSSSKQSKKQKSGGCCK